MNGGDLRLGQTDILRTKQRLPVKIAERNPVAIHQGDAPHTRAYKVLQHRCRQPACPNNQHMRCRQPVLTGVPELGQRDLARVAGHVVASIHCRTRASGSALSVISVTAETTSAPASNAPCARSTDMPPMAMRGMSPIRRFHSVSFSRPCSCHFIFLRMVG